MEQCKKAVEIVESLVVCSREASVEIVDQDEMQLKDGANETWVRNWCKAARNRKARKS